MAAILYNKPIVTDGLVYHIDPLNDRKCIPIANRTSPLSIVKEYNSGGIATAILDSEYPSNDPDWSTDGGGSINFQNTVTRSNGLGLEDNSIYGVTRFGTTDCYTVDFWFNRATVQSYGNDDYNRSLFSHADPFIDWSDASGNRYFKYANSIGINIKNNTAATAGNNGYYRIEFAARWAYGKPPSATIFNGNRYDFSTVTSWMHATRWYNFTGVFDLGNSRGESEPKLYVYINGNFNTSATKYGDATSTGSDDGGVPTFANNTKRQFGTKNCLDEDKDLNASGAPTGSYDIYGGANGKLGAFKIYNRSLTAEEIEQNYNALKTRYYN